MRHHLRCRKHRALPTGGQPVVPTDAISRVLMQDADRGEVPAQKTDGILRQKLPNEAALAGCHDLFYRFALVTLFSLIPALFIRRAR